MLQPDRPHAKPVALLMHRLKDTHSGWDRQAAAHDAALSTCVTGTMSAFAAYMASIGATNASNGDAAATICATLRASAVSTRRRHVAAMLTKAQSVQERFPATQNNQADKLSVEDGKHGKLVTSLKIKQQNLHNPPRISKTQLDITGRRAT